MNNLQNYYILGMTLTSAILSIFIENESVGIKILCITLVFTTFLFAFLYHNLKSKPSPKNKDNHSA